MKTIFSALAFTLILLLISCKPKAEQVSYQELSLMEPPAISANFSRAREVSEVSDVVSANKDKDIVAPASVPKIDKKKIIKDGNITIKVNDIENSKKRMDALVKSFNAYYDNESFQNREDRSIYNLQIRIPADGFERFLLSIENGNGEITNKSINARDVTEEYIDNETRLVNKKSYLKKYSDLLSQAHTVKDILELQENIRALQEEIESTEGRLKYLNDQIGYSTLSVMLFKTKEYVYKPAVQDKFIERVKTAISTGWASVGSFVIWIIKNWPLILLILLSILGLKRLIKKKNKQK